MKESSDHTYNELLENNETLLLPLSIRAVESQRPDALVRDEIAVSLVRDAKFDFSAIKHARNDEVSQLAVILRCRQFDRLAQEFLSQNPEAVVIHLGCGLDSRYERIDNGKVSWYDLDLPEVIQLRRELIATGGERYHQLAYSARLLDGTVKPTKSLTILI
jgi:O-methyltransferase involved in polyketide biosynthesis